MADHDSRAGQHYGSTEVLRFVEDTHAPHDEALASTYAAPAQEGMPAIHVSRSEARFLEVLMRLIGARRIVEVGTLAGYSALRLARALPPEGRLWTLEKDPHHAAVARRQVDLAGFSDRVEVCLGDAIETLAALSEHGPFDAVFIDADKERYPDYGAWALGNLRPGGLLVADNAFLFGKLMDQTSSTAGAMRAFHRAVASRFESACVPTPDGMVIGIRR